MLSAVAAKRRLSQLHDVCYSKSHEFARNAMTEASLADRILLGEDSALELKRVVVDGGHVRGPKRNGFADELSAMANGKGGTVVLGVDDGSRSVLGIRLEDLDIVEG